MDNRLVGKWYKDEMGETLNIFDETPLRIKMSFSSTGHYDFEPNCVYEKDGYLCFEINDEKYRMVYRIQYVDGRLEGYYTQFGKDTPVQYSFVSDEPEDKPYRFVPTVIYVPESEETRIEILKKYALYDRTKNESYETEYILGGAVPSILEKYGFSEYVKDVDPETDDAAFKLLDFVCDHFGHDGASGLPAKRKIEDIIAYCENHGGRINCRGLAILLASLLRLYSVKARHITCKPYEDPFDDCHVVVDCQLPSGIRIMLDPSFRLFLKDKEGEYVSLEHLRKMLIDGEPFFADEKASYNGGTFDELWYREYMTKNTLRFSRGTFCADGYEEQSVHGVELVPANYPTEKFCDSERDGFVYNDAVFWRM